MRARVRELWKRGARMAREQLFEADPLAHLDLHERPEETVLRLRWVGGAWVEDVARLKVAPAPFAEGSMRMCYHAKKMSSRATVRHAALGSKHASWRYRPVWKSSSIRLHHERIQTVRIRRFGSASRTRREQSIRPKIGQNDFDLAELENFKVQRSISTQVREADL